MSRSGDRRPTAAGHFLMIDVAVILVPGYMLWGPTDRTLESSPGAYCAVAVAFAMSVISLTIMVVATGFTALYAALSADRLPQWPPITLESWPQTGVFGSREWPDLGPRWAAKDFFRKRRGLPPLSLPMPSALISRLERGREPRAWWDKPPNGLRSW